MNLKEWKYKVKLINNRHQQICRLFAFMPYVQSVPQETRTRPSVETARPFTAPRWPGNVHTVRLYDAHTLNMMTQFSS